MSCRALTVQDISCLGQCSMAAALPVISACGVECALLPTALLSTHTGAEFTPPYIASLAGALPSVLAHWKGMGITFDGVGIGYLGSRTLVEQVCEGLDALCGEDTLVLLDPVMGDEGRFYQGFDADYAAAMRALCGRCRILLPNLTEACLLLDAPMEAGRDLSGCLELAAGLNALGAETVALTGLELRPHQITNLVRMSDGQYALLNHVRLPGSYHGTGDLFAAAVLGRTLRGDEVPEAVRRAGRFVSAAIARTPKEKRYGTCFEECLHLLWE